MDDREYLHMYREEESHWWYQGMRSIVRALLPPESLPRNPAILDAGCGTGFAMGWLRQQYHGRLVGVDCNWNSMNFCCKRRESALVCGDVASLPFSDCSFDLVVSFDVLSEVIDETARTSALRDFRRVLKPGGKLILRLPAYEWLRSGHDQAVCTRHRFAKRELSQAFDSAGLIRLDLTFANTILFPVAAIWRLSQTPGRGGSDVSPRTRGADWTNKLLTGVLRSEAALLRGGLRFPWGLSLVAVAARPCLAEE